MKLKRLAIAIPAGVLAAAPAHAADKILFGPPPEWVVQHPLPAAPPGPTDLPIQVLEVDTQVHVDGNTQTIYSAGAVKFLKAQGLQGGDLNLSWDPATETLTVNKVLIHRGDKTIDVLGQGQTFTVLRREQDLEQSMLTGTLTANLFPEGLQVGDVLEVVTTKTRSNPVTGDHAEQVFGPLNIPAGRLAVSIEWPKGRPMRLAESADLPPWQHGERGKFDTASLSLDNAQPVIPPTGAPLRFRIVRMAEAADYASWAQVADIFVPLYQKASQIPAVGPLRTELQNIRAASKDPVKRAEAALQLVENQVRYVALEMGQGGLVPADAAQTWSRKFGDCKAKTALLLGLLRELGIEAEPVVVNSKIGDAIHDRLPAADLFDHILVRATIAGKTYWLDGTRTGDTSLARLKVPDFGWGLPIRQGSALVDIVPPPLDQPSEDLTIELDASKGIRAPVPAKLEEILRGDAALGADQSLTALAGAARDQALREYWRNQFDFIEPEKYDFAFDQSTGELRMTMQGTATMEWDDGWYQTDKTGVGYRADFSRGAGANRDAPFAVTHPDFERTRETILLPPGFTGNITSDKTDVDETIGGFEYHRHVTVTGNKFFIERTQRSLVPELAFKDAVASQSRLRELADDGVYLRIPNSYRPTSADLDLLASTDSNDLKELLTDGETLEYAGRYADALPKFVHATELDPKNAPAWAQRALADTQTGKLDDAEIAIKQAAALDPKNVPMLIARGTLDEQRHDYQAALQEFEALLKLYPDNSLIAGHRVSDLVALGRPQEALDEVGKQIAATPQNLGLYLQKANLLRDLGRKDDAVKAASAMVAASPNETFAHVAAAKIYDAFGERTQALAEIDRALAIKPEAYIYVNRSQVLPADDLDGRLGDLEKALKLEPDMPEALSMKAVLLAHKGDYAGAAQLWSTLVQKHPDEANYLDERAIALWREGKRDDAQRDFAAERKLAKGAEALNNLCYQKAMANVELDLALDQCGQSLQLEPGAAHVLDSRGAVYLQMGRYKEAKGDFDSALEQSPRLETSLIGRAIARLRLGDAAGARADVAAARKIDPNALEHYRAAGFAVPPELTT
jgi:tetratricopeptide (TPR) repeat protein